MKKIILLTFLYAVILCAFTLLVPVKLYKTTRYQIDQYITISTATNSGKIDNYYANDTECGFYNYKAGLLYSFTAPENKSIAANKYGYILYDKVGDTITTFNPKNEKITEIKSFGYPYIYGENQYFFIIKTNGTGFSSYTFEGKPLINNIDYTSIISSISTDNNGNVLVSNLDGKSFLYTNKGELITNFDSDTNDSKITFTKSNSINSNGDYFAMCSGLDPEYIDIYQKKSNSTIQIKTDTNFRYKNIMVFNDNRLYYESTEKLLYFDIKSKQKGKIEIPGNLLELEFSQNGNIYTISENNNLFIISAYTSNGVLKAYKEFSEPLNNLKVIDNNIFILKSADKILTFKIGITS